MNISTGQQAWAELANAGRGLVCWGHPATSSLEMVPIGSLYLTQDEVCGERLIELLEDPDTGTQEPVDVARVDGKLVLVDGHHRTEVAFITKATHILALVREPAK